MLSAMRRLVERERAYCRRNPVAYAMLVGALLAPAVLAVLGAF